MSDDSPPPKPKPGSLRDRIAAFEQKPPSNAPISPPLRPKPGHVQWKPRSSSPPPQPINTEGGSGDGNQRMSAADAKESIGLGGLSLKERMAALQGRGAFAAPPPPAPKPAGDKPKWKPPPTPVAPSDNEGETETDHEAHASVKSPISLSEGEAGETTSEVTDGEKSAVHGQEEGEAAAEGGDNPEEEERQRRAAIAARLARLGGARIGMGPPVFAPKPRARTASQPSVKEVHVPAESTDEVSPSDVPDSATKADLPSAPSETSLLSADSGSSARTPPVSMPVPSGPRRAGPPRRRPPKSPTPPSSDLPPSPDAEGPATPLDAAERDEKKLEGTPPEEEEVAEETGEEAAARRKRIADRIAKSGGINPFAGPRPPQQEEEQEAEAEVAAEAAAEAGVESDAEAPPPSSDGADAEAEVEGEGEDEISPPPLPSKLTNKEVDEAKEEVESPVAEPTKEEETTVPVVDLSKPAVVSASLEDAEKNTTDITEAVGDYKDVIAHADVESETEKAKKAKGAEGDEKEEKDGYLGDGEVTEIDYDNDYLYDADEDEDGEGEDGEEIGYYLIDEKMSEENNGGSHEAVTNNTHAVGIPPTAICSLILLIDDDDGHEEIKQQAAGEHEFVKAADDNELARKHGSNLNDDDEQLQKMVPPRITRPLPPTPSGEHVNGVDEDVGGDSNEEQVSQPTSDSESPPATGTLNGNGEHDQAQMSPPPPPPPPPPPLPTPPGTKEQRIARRQSTTSAHTRSATDPSSSSSTSSASSNQNNTNSFPGLKRNNTINSFTPPRSPSPGRINGNTNTNGYGRRPGSPPPVVKPKPASLSFKNQNQRRKTHERASSTGATPLLKTALMQGAAAAAAATAAGGKPHAVGADSEKERIEEPPERRASVSQLARSLESVIQFGTPGSPGSTPGRRASAQSLAKKKKAVKDSEPESMNEGEDASDGKGDKAENKRRSPSPSRTSTHSLSPELKAAIASVAAAKVASAASTRASSPPPPPRPPRASFVPASAPRPPTPPVSPPTTMKAQAVSSSSVPSSPSPPTQTSRSSSVPPTPAPGPPPPPPPPPLTVLSSTSTDSFVSAFTSTSPPATEDHFAPAAVVPEKTEVTTTVAPTKRYSVPPPPRPPPPPPAEAEADTDTDADGDADGDEETVKFNGVETTPKPLQRDMQPLSPPTPVAEKPEEEEEGDLGKEAKAESEPELEKVDDGDAESGKGTFGAIVVQEPEQMSGVEDGRELRDSDSADEGDDSTDSEDEDEKQESFKSARSNNDSSCPPTPPVKQGFSFQLTSKWSRNTSVVASPNASAITLAHSPSPTAQSHEQSQDDTLAVHSDEDKCENEDEDEDEDENENENDKHDNESNVNNVHDDYDPRFPPVSSFPPPPPLPFKKRSTSVSPPAFPGERRIGFGPENAGESETSLASLPEGDASDEGDGGSDIPRFKSKTKATLTSAIAAALGRSQPEISSYTLSQTVTDSASRSSSEETNPLARQVRARLAKLDGFVEKTTSTRPAPFPSVGDGNQGQSQSAPEVPQLRLGQEGMSTERKRQVRLSSKLLPITAAKRMNTMPAGVGAWGKNKAVMSSETVGTIGTIGTEPGDLETSQFGSISRAPSSFWNKRPAMRRQTTSQSSRFVEDLPVPLPFLKRSIDPRPQRATTISFSNRTRTGSEVGGPPTRKMSLVTGMRAATIEAVERPISAISGDFVLVEEPEEFDIPRAEWDLPRIPSGSLGFPSTVDLTKPNWAESSRLRSRPGSPATIHNRSQSSSTTSNEGGRSGPSSAPATTAPSMPMAPLMAHSRSATTGTSGTSRTAETAKTYTSAPPGPISSQTSTGSESSPRLSSDALLDLWGRVGVYVSDAAALLHDKSRRVLVGDGTYPGFVLAVARQVPAACVPSRSARYPYGHLIYFQTAATVHKRYAGIMPGDVIVLQNALFKGVRGPLHQSYQEEIGTKGDPVVGVIGEFEARKSKVRVYQANQHVGVQTVEYVSYRFEDLKSGTIKIFRVPDS